MEEFMELIVRARWVIAVWLSLEIVVFLVEAIRTSAMLAFETLSGPLLGVSAIFGAITGIVLIIHDVISGKI